MVRFGFEIATILIDCYHDCKHIWSLSLKLLQPYVVHAYNLKNLLLNLTFELRVRHVDSLPQDNLLKFSFRLKMKTRIVLELVLSWSHMLFQWNKILVRFFIKILIFQKKCSRFKSHFESRRKSQKCRKKKNSRRSGESD